MPFMAQSQKSHICNFVTNQSLSLTHTQGSTFRGEDCQRICAHILKPRHPLSLFKSFASPSLSYSPLQPICDTGCLSSRGFHNLSVSLTVSSRVCLSSSSVLSISYYQRNQIQVKFCLLACFDKSISWAVLCISIQRLALCDASHH